jgi:hypothetical protein
MLLELVLMPQRAGEGAAAIKFTTGTATGSGHGRSILEGVCPERYSRPLRSQADLTRRTDAPLFKRGASVRLACLTSM